jgi:carbon monoxide dehydrogenase subunit G
MVEVERTFTVERSPADTFAYLADFSNAEAWDPGTVTCRRLDDGPLGVGSSFANVSEFRGRRTELAYRIIRHEPMSRLTFEGVNKTVTSTDDMRFEPAGGGTRITYHAQLRFKGLARLAGPFLKRGFEKLADETEGQMRTTLERAPGSSPAT